MFMHKIDPRAFVSTLWIFILFNMILRDLHEFPTAGYIENMMSLHLSDEVMLLFAFIVEIPILMILLSRILNTKVNAWANTIATVLAAGGILHTLPAGQLDEIFFAIMNMAAIICILVTVWKLATPKNPRQVSS